MEGILWSFKTFDGFTIAWPIAVCLGVCLLVSQHDFLVLLGRWLWRHAFGTADTFRRARPGERPVGLVIIPSLLRNRDDFDAITTTLESCAANEYPSDLVVVASVDGRSESPLYAELCAWMKAQTFPSNVHVHAAGTETRLGKMMAVEAGVKYVRGLVARGELDEFPPVYFSIDGDGTLSANALERLVDNLMTPHPITGNYERIVSGKICIRPDLFWRGLLHLFTVRGQLTLQVAREFVVSNVARSNMKITPMIGVPGALYCTWREVLVEAPRYMGFMQSITAMDCVRWWLGYPPPSFAASTAPALPEALTGASDDTCIAFIASIAHWENGKLSFEAARTPLHAFGRLLWAYFVERSHGYEPEARVFTYTPPTLKGLWVQRVRWNSSRFECGGRFWRAFWFHWEIGFPVTAHLWLVLQTVLEMTTYYVLLPYYCLGTSHAFFGFLIGYVSQTTAHALYTLMALSMEREYRRFWPTLFALPLASFYATGINFFGCVYGVANDLLFFGNWTNFAPEWTFIKSRCERVAVAFRIRRFYALAIRALVHGDVPFGAFWLGWRETPWTPNGFEGWTTGKRPRSILAGPVFPPHEEAPEPIARVSRPSLRLVPPLPETEPALVNASTTRLKIASGTRPSLRALQGGLSPSRTKRSAGSSR